MGFAQDNLSLQIADVEGVTPEAGDLSFSLLLGRSNFLYTPYVPNGPGNSSNWTTYSSTAFIPQTSTTNELTNMVGTEIRYFVLQKLAIKVNGGAVIRSNPGVVNTPTVIDYNAPNVTWIPAYASVEGTKDLNLNFSLGIEFQSSTKFSRLFPYYGISFPFYYSLRSEYDPASYTRNVYNGSSSVAELYLQDIGWRHGEQAAFGAQLVGGFDYYLMEGMFIGFEIKPFSYIYSFNTVSPGPGLPKLQTESTTIGVFSQPLLKMGFRF